MSRSALPDSFVFTFDLDWAPDFVVDWLSDRLLERGLPATWFVTHLSPAVRRLAQHSSLFELGIHPNFTQPSSHGREVSEIVQHCLDLVPDALSMRAHSLHQSTRLFTHVLEKTEIRVDASLFLPGYSVIEPVEFTWGSRTLLRIPFFWEDDLAMQAGLKRWDPAALVLPEGPKVMNFHPMHLYLNSASMATYEDLKCRVPSLTDATPEDLASNVNAGLGVMTLFEGVCDGLLRDRGATTLRALFQTWNEMRNREPR